MSDTIPDPIDIRKGDINVGVSGICYQNGKPVDIAALTLKFGMVNSSGTVVIAETATGVTIHPTTTVTLDSTNNWITANGHTLTNGTQIVFATAGSLSGTGLTAATRYVVQQAEDNCFRVGLTRSSAAITIAGAGTGAHTYYVVGQVTYSWQSTTPVNTIGDFPCEFRAFNGSASTSFPCNQSIKAPRFLVRVHEGLGT